MSNTQSSNINNASEIKKITWIGLIVNVFLSIVKFTVGFFGSSQALIADAIHSLSDLSTDFAILFGVQYWSKPADETHPYGHKRIETMVTAGISIFLFGIAVSIGYRSLVAIQSAHIKQPGWIAFFGAVISIVVKEILYHRTEAVGRRVKSPAVIANAWHHRTDAFSSVPVALAVAAAAINPTWAFLDRIGAFIVSLAILRISFKMIYPVFSELVERGASQRVKEEIGDITLSVDNVKSVHAIRARRMGSDLYVDLHVMVDGQMSVQQGHEVSRAVKHKLLDQCPDIVDVVVHLEPFKG